jgi:hypothetical protein
MVDIRKMAEPKSDQLNADDLIGGPRTIVITRVKELSSDEQPLAIYFEGDNGKPYKPGKSMMRALMFVWGPEGDDYVGRAMTLYRDPDIMFGPDKVGGIRISHMSHISRPESFPLTAKRGKRQLYTVEPLRTPEGGAQRPRKSLEELVDAYESAVGNAADVDALMTLQQSENAQKLRDRITADAGDEARASALLARMTQAGSARFAALSAPAEEEGPVDDGASYQPDDEDLDDAFASDPQ